MKTMWLIALILGALSVGIGAFGAHGLKTILEANQCVDTFETAVRYQFYHVFALLVVLFLGKLYPNMNIQTPFWLFLVGILIFSGSLYILCLTGIKWLGAITPIGGVFLILGWIITAWNLRKVLA